MYIYNHVIVLVLKMKKKWMHYTKLKDMLKKQVLNELNLIASV